MLTAVKFRLYPFPDQARELDRQLSELNSLWNHALEERCAAWKKERRSLTFVQQCQELTRWRNFDREGLGRVNAQVAQECLARLNDAFQHFFRRVKSGEAPGFPRFNRETTSLTYPQAYDSVRLVPGRNGTRRLSLSRVGDLPIEVHRELPAGRTKTCTVEREGDRWYAVLIVEMADPVPPPDLPPRHPLGVDLGLSRLATLSTGEAVEAPRFLRRSEVQLKRQQRRLSRKRRGSHNWRKQKARVQRCHARVRDQRRDLAHQLTSTWAREHDLIAFEDLDVRSHLMGPFSKSTADAGWGMLRRFAEYKEARRSGRYVEVPSKGTTQSCSACARPHDPPLTLRDRTYECPCGLRLDRDVNAARNVLARALAIVGGDTPEVTPVEIGPPVARKGRRVRSMKQEPPSAVGAST
ncbi:MAG: transposase [Euryarchaeota archaeon]|nr:transposase [Euryarchaeota archaeon]MDE2045094.1 transposase [Thermoplasmata archaeon]